MMIFSGLESFSIAWTTLCDDVQLTPARLEGKMSL